MRGEREGATSPGAISLRQRMTSVDAGRCPGRLTRASRDLAALLVALRERIGLHQVFCLVDEVVRTVGARASDTGLAPQVVVLVNAHVAFRRALELDAGRRRRDLVDIERAGLFHCELPQPWPEIGSLRDVADHGLVAPHLVEGGHEAL